MTTQVDGWWEIKFSLLGRSVASVEANNLLTNERLTSPGDNDRLAELLPYDMWPQFARPKLNIPEGQDTLFQEGMN
jgi:hypothetical protein